MTHAIPKTFEPFTSMQVTPLNQTVIRRCNQCDVLTNLHVCSHCTSFEQKSKKKKEKMSKRKLETLQQPAKLNAPISLTSPERLKLTIQNYRLENKELQAQVEKLKNSLDKSAVLVSDELSSDLKSIMSHTDQKHLSPFMKLFWEEQQKYIASSKHGIRYHPMVIRYCLSL